MLPTLQRRQWAEQRIKGEFRSNKDIHDEALRESLIKYAETMHEELEVKRKYFQQLEDSGFGL